MQHTKNNYRYNRILVIMITLMILTSCNNNSNNSKVNSYCVDLNVCYKTVFYNKTDSDSIRFIFYKKNEIGKEVYVKGNLDSIIINDLSKLKTYYSEYRHMQYVGQSLFTNKCFGCHNFYPDIVHDLKLTDSLKLDKINEILINTHGKIRLNPLELEAIYQYIRPKRDMILPRQ